MYIQHFFQLYCVKFSFKLADTFRSFDGCSRGPLFLGMYKAEGPVSFINLPLVPADGYCFWAQRIVDLSVRVVGLYAEMVRLTLSTDQNISFRGGHACCAWHCRFSCFCVSVRQNGTIYIKQ